ncbi:gamma-glutamyltransferase [Nitrincola alkalilacustris]|uniref:gamma-glutamyltransferase n=1 Tax=Nitrincola alkalilacustris TaxID=1571224 RepID=UPI00124CCDD0|nr:gamma-glutamyltransferase [Nitrincola alkalilacustris]
MHNKLINRQVQVRSEPATGKNRLVTRLIGKYGLLIGVLLLLQGCSDNQEIDLSSRQTLDDRQAEQFMVAAAHPLAVEAGLEVMRRGGNAIDAAIAVQMVLGFVEPPESGIGGGGFMLFHDSPNNQIYFFDGRETAPASADEKRFTLLGQPVPRPVVIPSGRAVGVPGLMAMLEMAHSAHGTLPWHELFEPAASLAEQGIPMPDRLKAQIDRDPSLLLFRDTRSYFKAQARGDEPQLHNPLMSDTLRTLADQGAAALYQGELGERFIRRASAPWIWPGDLQPSDFEQYKALQRDPVCGPYRQWTICGAPPPSSGGITLLQILGMLEQFPLPQMEYLSADTLHLIAEASRLAFADREFYIGDPDFVDVPTQALIDPDYLHQRAELINQEQALIEISPGIPGQSPLRVGKIFSPQRETTGTTHFSIVDADGRMVALTSSNEMPFGNRRMTDGFLLNNQLTDFSFVPHLDGQPHPNAVAPGKRPRSSMSPVIVFDARGNTQLVIGSRGGSRIIGYVLKTLLGVLDWNLDLQDAIALPNMIHRGDALELEQGTQLTDLSSDLQARGHKIRIISLESGLHGIERTDSGWRGGADPRLDGVARGD